MATATEVLHELLDPVSECLTPEVAKELVRLRASPKTQARLEELANKSQRGEISAEERAEYETYVSAGTFIAILQSKARKRSLLNRSGAT